MVGIAHGDISLTHGARWCVDGLSIWLASCSGTLLCLFGGRQWHQKVWVIVSVGGDWTGEAGALLVRPAQGGEEREEESVSESGDSVIRTSIVGLDTRYDKDAAKCERSA